MTIDVDVQDLPGQMATLGLAVTPDALEQAKGAAGDLVQMLGPVLADRARELVAGVSKQTWRELLVRCPRGLRGPVLKNLGLPPVRVNDRLVTDVTNLFQRGLHQANARARSAAHDLTESTRQRLLQHAATSQPWPDADPVSSAGRAIAVAVCPDYVELFLPIVLGWMRQHDSKTFKLLLPDADQQQALDVFREAVGLVPDAASLSDLSIAAEADSETHHYYERGVGHVDAFVEDHAAVPEQSAPDAHGRQAGDDIVADTEKTPVPQPAAPAPAAVVTDTTLTPLDLEQTEVDLTALSDSARRAVQTAIDGCASTLERLRAGQAPAAAALAELSAARRVLVETAGRLSGWLGRDVEPALAAIDAAVEEMSHNDDERELLQALLAAKAPQRALSALQTAVAQARELLDAWPPSTPQDKATTQLLAEIAKLACDAAGDDVDDDDIESRFEQLSATAPAEFTPLLNAALRGRVAVPLFAPRAAVPRAMMPASRTETETVAALEPQRAPKAFAPARSADAQSHGAQRVAHTRQLRSARPAPMQPTVEQLAVEQPMVEQPDEPAPAAENLTADSQAATISESLMRTAHVEAEAYAERAVETPAPARTAVTLQADTTAATDSTPPVAAYATEELAALTAKAAHWIRIGQYTLAAHLLRPHLPGVAAAAELAALTTATTGPSGPHELELNARATTAEIELLIDGDAARLLTTGAALLATAVTGSVTLGNLLINLSERMDSAGAALARPLGEAARTGQLAGQGLAALTHVAADEADVVQAAARAAGRACAARMSRLPRAAAVLSRLRTPSDGSSGAPQTLGDALHAAAQDWREDVEAVNVILGQFSKPSALDRLIDDDDKAYRAAASKPIGGTVRQEMVSTLREDIAAVARWVAACQQHSPSRSDYVNSQLTRLRDTLMTRHTALLSLLHGRQSDPDPLVSAAAAAAEAQVQGLVQLLSGRHAAVAAPEPDAQETLRLPLLALPQARWDPPLGVRLDPPLDTNLAALSTALLAVPDCGLDLLAAAATHVQHDDFRTARHLLQRLSESQRSEQLSALDTQQATRIEQLGEQLRAVQRRLSRSRVADPDTDSAAVGSPVPLDAATEDQLSRQLDRAISLLDETDPDVRAATETAAAVRIELERLQEHSRTRLRTQLDELSATGDINAEDLERIRRRIGEGKLDLAADDITHLSAGEALFDPDDNAVLAEFYPAAIRGLPDGIDAALLKAVREGARHQFLPPQPLPEAVREDVHNGLAGWRSLRSAFETGWKREHVPDSLLPALRLVGLDARSAAVDHLDGKPFAYARGRRFLDINGAAITGKALVPAFGSAAQGRYRLLLVWNSPTVEQLDEWRDADGSHLPLIICYLGTLSAADRLALAARWADPSHRPTLLLDDAVLAWVATRRGTFETFMRLTLPFTATQPFRREKRADVPPEMFYGRARERRQLMNPNGPSVVYGGRGLGKSALLYTIERDADASLNDDLAVVWIEVDRISGITDDPSLLWGELVNKLESKGVSAGARAGRSNPRDRVAKAVKSRTEQPGKRLLILLDEAEGFFNGDAPQFADVRRLYQLSSETDFRCKVVFSGLHSVQHYYAAGNIPFSPTGHLQIGPLSSQSAYQLLTQPLAAVGYKLSEDDAQRVLLHCNYQPYLVQLVAEKLLSTQLDRRAASKTPLVPPPWTIGNAEVLAALNDPQTRRDLRAALGLTLDIDKRTRIITSVLALYAYDNPPGARMLAADLYAECRTAWPSGFASTTLVAFRELLNELAGLGILADVTDDGGGRAIRNETLLLALGNREDAERHLQEVALNALPVLEARGQERPVRRDDIRRSPLTTAQLGQLFRKGNTARVIVGTTATGIDQVTDTLIEVAPAMVTVETPSTVGAYRSLLESGATDAKRMLVVSDLTGLSNVDTCNQSLTLALGDSSGAGLPRNRAASRTVALLAGQNNVDWLLEIAARADFEEIVVPLERYNQYTLPLRWRGEGGLDLFADGNLGQEVLDVTDGWPQLVDELAGEATRRRGRAIRPTAALEQMRARQNDANWCRSFLTATGALLPSWPDMARLLEVLVEYEAPCNPKDVSVLAADKVIDLQRTARLAQWFGLVTLTDTDELALSPLLAACWRTSGVVAE